MNTSLWPGHLLAGLAGALATLAFSPFDYWWLMPVSAGVFYLLLNQLSVKAACWRGFWYGAGLFGAGTSWVYVSIHQFGSAPVPLAALLTALFVAGLSVLCIVPVAALFGRLAQDRAQWQKTLLFAGLWVLGEWFRTWFLTGFPWLFAGYTLLDTPFAGLAPVAGVYGLSLLTAITAAALFGLMVDRSRSQITLAAITLALAGLTVTLQDTSWTQPSDKQPLSFAAVQGNISQDLKWKPGHLQNTVNTYTRLSASQWDKDLLFWPENSIPTFYQNLPDFMASLDQQASNTNTALVLGMPWYDNNSQQSPKPYYNSLIGLGEADGHYFKQKLVPFGEFVPFESWLRGVIAFFDLPMSSFSRGSDDQKGLIVNQLPMASYICYEVVYPDFVASQAVGKEALLTVSNDTWFGSSIGPEQHFQMVRMRSLETGRYQLRVTNDGITALVAANGSVIKAIPRYQSGVLEGELPLMTGATPFMRFGSWPVLLLSALLILPALIRRKAQTLKKE